MSFLLYSLAFLVFKALGEGRGQAIFAIFLSFFWYVIELSFLFPTVCI